MVFYVIVSIVIILALVGLTVVLFVSGNDEYRQRQATVQLYKQLDTDFTAYRTAATNALDQATREVERTQQFLLREHQRGHDARLDIIRLASEFHDRS